THHTYQFSSAPAANAGPNHRAGFIAAPVSGPPIRMSAATARPIAIPPRLGARASTAVPNTTRIRITVRTASMAIPAAGLTPAPRARAPTWVGPHAAGAKRRRSRRPAAKAPASWATTNMPARAAPNRPATHSANETAGLNWPLPTPARALTSTANTRPWASATPTRPEPPEPAMVVTTMAPAP